MELLQIAPAWVLILLLIIVAATIIIMAVNYLKNKKLEEIREDVYVLFLKAEHMYKESSAGQQKLKWVVSQARGLLPKWVQLLISEETLMDIIDEWFMAIKDLLDDGKMNGSTKGNNANV